MARKREGQRVIAHVDLDCFYVQVEQRRRPELLGKPTAVVQYNNWKGGGCIAVGYEARKCGVKRSMRGDEAKAVCPDIHLVQVPVAHEKADLTIYRDAGSEVVAVLSRVGRCERASIDEVYLDITEAAERLACEEPEDPPSDEVCKTHVVGNSETKEWFGRANASWDDQLLARAAILVADIRMKVFSETGFTCSAGISHNKMLAKLASGMHKPAQQTLVPLSAVEGLLATLPITKIGQLGGKLGKSLEADLGVKTAGDLLQFSEKRLQDLYGTTTGTWLWNVARGVSVDEVQDRVLPKSHSTGKTFPGPRSLKDMDSVQHWISELATALQDRLDTDLLQNNRVAHLLTIHASCNLDSSTASKFPSRSCTLRYGKEKLAEDACKLFERGLRGYFANQGLPPSKHWTVTGLFLGASNISDKPLPITRFFGSSNVVSSSDHSNPGNGNVSSDQGDSSSIQTDSSTSLGSRPEELCDDRERSMKEPLKGNSPQEPCRKKPVKLEELWQREKQGSTKSWDYTQQEIDESVLLELPPEIQLELQRHLGLKKPRPSSIADFFKQ